MRCLLTDIDDPTAQCRKYKVNDLPIQKDLNNDEIVADLKQVEVQSAAEFESIYAQRIGLRKKGKTNLNEESSRSHCFTLIKVVKRGYYI